MKKNRWKGVWRARAKKKKKIQKRGKNIEFFCAACALRTCRSISSPYNETLPIPQNRIERNFVDVVLCTFIPFCIFLFSIVLNRSSYHLPRHQPSPMPIQKQIAQFTYKIIFVNFSNDSRLFSRYVCRIQPTRIQLKKKIPKCASRSSLS